MPKDWVHPLLRKKGAKIIASMNRAPVVASAVSPVSPVSVSTPDLISPMLASKGDLLTVMRLANDSNWIAERKLDGGRYMLYLLDGNARLFSRHISVKNDQLVEKTDNVPHLTYNTPAELNGTVLDAEVTRPGADFGGVIQVMGSLPAEAIEKQRTGMIYLNVFDCPRHNGKDITSLPMKGRRAIAEKVVKALKNPCIVMVEQRTEGKMEFYKEVVAEGGEGIILKNLDAVYTPGKRSSSWVKMKKAQTYDVVVMGFEQSDSETFKAKGWIRSVIFGVYRAGKLVQVGTTSGMTQNVRADMSMNPSKYIGQVVEVEGQEVLRDGIRHPRYLRMRPDANPTECTFNKLMVS
jgi:bifunctional non-homologous end joining protein LigD